MPRSSVITAIADKVPLFSPADVAGLQLWLDASDTATITESGGSVSQWDDKSGNANHVSQGTAAEQPTTGTRTINSKNALDFVGNDLEVPNIGVPNPSTGEWTIISVALPDTLSGDRRIAGGNNGFRFGYQPGAASANVYDSSGFLATDTTPGAATGSAQVLSATADSVNIEMFLNGASDGPTAHGGTLTTSSPTSFVIGAYNTFPSGPFDGAIAEVLIYDSALSTADREAVEQYLADRWGVTLAKQPDEVDGLQLWLDASDTSTITESGGAVSQWDDKSGNGNHVSQGTAANQPTTGVDTLNSLNVISYDGDDILVTTNEVYYEAASGWTYIAVYQHVTEAFILLGSGDGTPYIGTGESGSSTTGTFSDFTSPRTYYKNGASQTTPANRGEMYTLYGEQTAIAAITTGPLEDLSNSARKKVSPFAYINANFRPQVKLAEVALYDRILSTADREALELHMAAKWGITLS